MDSFLLPEFYERQIFMCRCQQIRGLCVMCESLLTMVSECSRQMLQRTRQVQSDAESRSWREMDAGRGTAPWQEISTDKVSGQTGRQI